MEEYSHPLQNDINYKYAFQEDAYRPLDARISQHALVRGVSFWFLPRGVFLVSSWGGGSTPGGGESAPGGRGSAPRGVCSRGWIPACTETDPPPPVNRIEDLCKNITLPQLRRGRKLMIDQSAGIKSLVFTMQ